MLSLWFLCYTIHALSHCHFWRIIVICNYSFWSFSESPGKLHSIFISVDPSSAPSKAHCIFSATRLFLVIIRICCLSLMYTKCLTCANCLSMCLWWSCGVLPPSPVYFHVASTFTSIFIYYVLDIVNLYLNTIFWLTSIFNATPTTIWRNLFMHNFVIDTFIFGSCF